MTRKIVEYCVLDGAEYSRLFTALIFKEFILALERKKYRSYIGKLCAERKASVRLDDNASLKVRLWKR